METFRLQAITSIDKFRKELQKSYSSEKIAVKWDDFKINEDFYCVDKVGLDAFLPRNQRVASAFLPANLNDQVVVKTIMRYAAINSKHIARRIVNVSFTEKEGVNHASFEGSAITISLSPLFDERVPLEVRFNTVAAIINHELFHCRYTTPGMETLLKRKGKLKKGLNKFGKEIQVADFSSQSLQELLEGGLFKDVLNILEDHRIEKIGMRDFPGYVYLFDDYRRYAAWRRNNHLKKSTAVSTDPLVNDQFLLDYLFHKTLLPERLDYFLDYSESTIVANTRAKCDIIDKHVERAISDNSFEVTYESTVIIHELFSKEFREHYTPKDLFGEIVLSEEALDALNELMQEVIQELGEENGSIIDKEVKKIKPSPRKNPKALTKVIVELAKPAEFNSRIYNEAKVIARNISANLAFLDSRFNRTTEMLELQHGDLDESALYSLKFRNRDLFYDEEETQGYSLDIGILVDESGSMRGRKIEEAKIATLALALALQANEHINLFVYGHTADMPSEPFVMYRYLDPASRAIDVNTLFGIESRSCNADGYAIEQMGEILKQGESRQKVLIVISDGQPAAACYGGWFGSDEGVEHTHQVVQQLERENVFVVQIAVGDIENSDKMFTHFIPYDGTQLGQNLKKVLNKKLIEISNVI